MSITREWTVMLYMAGDNDLDDFGVADLNEVKKAGSSSAVNLVAQFDRQGRVGTKRYLLNKGTSLEHDVVVTLGETNTGDSNVLKDFVIWAVQTYPAKKYALILWNHGAGWDDTNVYRTAARSKIAVTRGTRSLIGSPPDADVVPSSHLRAATTGPFRRSLFSTTMVAGIRSRAILFDDGARDMLDNIEMKRVLKEIKTKVLRRKLDVLAMDACLMNMVEVGIQVEDTADVLIGSEESEPGEGWPYDDVLKALVKNPKMTGEMFARTVVKRYLSSYSAADEVTQGALRLSSMKKIASAVNKLAKELKAALNDRAGKMAIMEARAAVQSFEIYESYAYVDLYDFCDLVARRMNGAVQTACAATKRAITAAIIEASSKGRKVSHAHGISIYFPLTGVSRLYRTLDFAKSNVWPDFLDRYIEVTRTRDRNR
jgi:Clostripain family